ncbi:MAG: potassium transporter TrkH, partial [Gemmatimonadetes bacterium]|nr:potassium transporter TrkH [Gemmatimonadota bacterium]
AVASLVSPDDRSRVFSATQQLLLFTFACEAVGAILLFLAFRGGGETAGPAAWRATFTAVSAFCNAGFALQSDSLVGYQNHPVVLHVVATLIILGSLSPAVVLGLPRFFRRRGRPVALQAKLALGGSAVLLGGAFLAILAFEWSQSLAGLGFWDRLHNAWFQSVTLRTAGFNSIDFTAVRSATLSVMMLCMFIGGAPGGTAGGIKVTTAAVLLLLVAHGIRGGFRVTVFGRRIPASVVSRATVVTALGALSVLGATIALLLTQSMPTRDALFEIVSALGTVGLSTGGTAQLDGVGKLIVLSCMFAGRVGPLTLLLFLHQRTPPVQVERPEEEVQVG